MTRAAARFAALALAATTLGGCATMQNLFPLFFPAGAPEAPAADAPADVWEPAQLEYLEWIAEQPEWTAHESGIFYRKIEGEPQFEDHPEESSTVTIHYEGKLISGDIFDSSYERGQPAQFPLRSLIRGWREGVPLMRIGETFEFVIPAELAYGDRARPNIPANSTLIFKIELIRFY